MMYKYGIHLSTLPHQVTDASSSTDEALFLIFSFRNTLDSVPTVIPLPSFLYQTFQPLTYQYHIKRPSSFQENQCSSGVARSKVCNHFTACQLRGLDLNEGPTYLTVVHTVNVVLAELASLSHSEAPPG